MHKTKAGRGCIISAHTPQGLSHCTAAGAALDVVSFAAHCAKPIGKFKDQVICFLIRRYCSNNSSICRSDAIQKIPMKLKANRTCSINVMKITKNLSMASFSIFLIKITFLSINT